MELTTKKQVGIFSVPVLVAALGYFVDIYDLLLFGIIRVPSLNEILNGDAAAITTEGEKILGWQMAGLMIGGIIWGVLGDKKGRLSVLFGSILLYSIANIANGFVQDTNTYALVRFIAGIGLAGELGAGITLVSELVSKEKRGLATSMVAGIGLTGAVVAFVMKENFSWRICYFIGGGLGVALLLLRISVFESGMFNDLKEKNISRGNLLMLVNNRDRFFRYVKSVMIGLPTWFVIGVLVTFSKEFGEAFSITEPIDSGRAIMYAYAAIAIGDILIGLVSQWLKSRKKALYIFYSITAVFMVMFFTGLYHQSAAAMYWVCAGLGFGTGFWAIFVTMGAEQFGTNIRATAATTIPNMVRGMLTIFILPVFQFLRAQTDYVTGAWLTGAICMAIAVVSAILVKETFHKDLDYIEEMTP